MFLSPRSGRFSTTEIPPMSSTLLLYVLGLFILISHVSALEVVPGSKCESLCSDSAVGNLHDDVRCLEAQYDTAPGLSFKQCITCQLNSTAVDPSTNASDVQWALFNIRYALSNCMFGYPEERVSISSPCQVTCAPLQEAVTAAISNSTNTTDYSASTDYCHAGRFDDTTINNCAFCYSFIDQQLFLGNFLQALHIACYSPPLPGNTFYPDGNAIFNLTTIAGPTGAKPPPPSGNGLTGTKLILAIVLPVVGGIIILAATCFCCWHFTRKRRQSMAASGRMSKFHDGHAAGSPSPKWREAATELERIQVVPKMTGGGQRRSPGLAQGRYQNHGDHDEAGEPLNSADQERFHQGGPPGPPLRQDSHLHDQFIGTATSQYAEPFHAQDGYLREY